MSWTPMYGFGRYYASEQARRNLQALRANEQCFIRKGHECGKICGGSKSCFIACPTDDELEPILGLISEKLAKAGIEAIIAVKERAYGQDIFCTKICGKIIEAQFCIVILDDAVVAGVSIPNPNVYYEYGLMTSLGKHIVPLQKESLELAFNIQSYDTIKYSAKNIATELERAIKDAVKLVDTGEQLPRGDVVSEKTILRSMELAGFKPASEKWFLADAISDTEYRGFSHEDKRFYTYLAKVDDDRDAKSCVEDLGVVVYRTERKAEQLDQEIQRATLTVDALRREQSAASTQELALEVPREWSRRRSGTSYEERVSEAEGTLFSKRELAERIACIHVGFVVSPELDGTKLMAAAEDVMKEHPRFRLTRNTANAITFEDVAVELSSPSI